MWAKNFFTFNTYTIGCFTTHRLVYFFKLTLIKRHEFHATLNFTFTVTLLILQTTVHSRKDTELKVQTEAKTVGDSIYTARVQFLAWQCGIQ